MSPTKRIRLVVVAAGVLALAASLAQPLHAPTWWAVFALAAGVAVSEAAVVSLQFGRQTWAFSLTESVLGAAWVAGGAGSWSVVGVAAGVLVAQLYLKRPAIKKQFNVVMFACATALGSLIVAASGGGTAGAIAGLGGFFLVNHVLVAVAVSLTTNRPLVGLIVNSMPLSAVHMAGNSSIGLLAAFLAGAAPLGLLGLLVPLALLWSSYDQQTRRSQEARLFAELAAGQERAGRSSDISAQAVVTAAARLFGGADVELVLLASDGPVRYAGDESGMPLRERVDIDVFDEPWVLNALGAGGVTTGADGSRPWCSALLGDPETPRAVLIARRQSGSAPFGRREVRLAEVLVGQADTWLSAGDLTDRAEAARRQADAAGNAARALGDLGAATAPALTVLRDSANRLARLAESDGQVDDIVDELHLVERAVASLLGAIALAADPDLVSTDTQGLASPVRPSADWTTTGVLR